MLIVGIALAGAVGAPTRYLVDRFVQRRTEGDVPLGTFVVNVSGSVILGFIVGLGLYHAFPDTPSTVLGSGFCGAYTTFSTFTYETLALDGGVCLRRRGLERAAERGRPCARRGCGPCAGCPVASPTRGRRGECPRGARSQPLI